MCFGQQIKTKQQQTEEADIKIPASADD